MNKLDSPELADKTETALQLMLRSIIAVDRPVLRETDALLIAMCDLQTIINNLAVRLDELDNRLQRIETILSN